MIYAPVYIPTLNRYEHFKECLESLERCTGADKTTVYIGLDYPPSEKYIDGWRKIDGYLREKECFNKFAQLVVFRRKHNCGVGNPNSNAMLLKGYVSEKHDRWISSEDDNVFSPNFLEYINKGLEKYENDPTIFAIVGYSHPYHFKYLQNNHFRHNTDLSAWGFGQWKNKWDDFTQYIENQGLRKSFSLRNVVKAKRHGWLRLFDYLHYCHHRGYIWLTDGVMSTYMIVNDKYVIVPTLSKVRNNGWDGSGNSSQMAMSLDGKLAERHMSQEIDSNSHFDYVGDDKTYMEYNNKVAVKESDVPMSFWDFSGKILKLMTRSLFKG